MKEWEKELYIYRLTPAPPKETDLQKYISNYRAQKDDKYILILSILVDTFISKISLPMQPVPEIGSISVA